MQNSWLTSKAEYRTSPIHGVGIFAKETIKQDEFVAIKGGHILQRKEFEKNGSFKSEIGKVTLQIADDFFIGPRTAEEIDAMTVGVNHSCNGSIGFLGNVISVAIRDINKDEEITNDYGLWLNDENFELNCNCGSNICRRKITGKNWMNTNFQKKYREYFSLYLQRKLAI